MSRDYDDFIEVPDPENDDFVEVDEKHLMDPKPNDMPGRGIMGKFFDLPTVGRGAAQGASAGYIDELAGAGGALVDQIKGTDDTLGESYRMNRDKYRAGDMEAKKKNPVGFGGGEILGGGLGMAALPAASGIKGAMALGALQGLGSSESDLTQGDLIGAGKDAAIGAALGGGVGIAGRAAKALGPKSLKEFANRRAAAALGAERGTIKKMGEDEIQAIGNHALENKIVTPLAGTDEMIARNQASKKAAGNMMDEVYSSIDNKGASEFNPVKSAAKVDQELGGFYNSPLNKAERKQFENTLEAIMVRGRTGKNIPIKEAQLLKEELGKAANWKNNVTVTPKEQIARDAYGIIAKEIDSAVDAGAGKIGSKGLLKKLQSGKKQYGHSKGAEKLLENRQAREVGNKMGFGLTDSIMGGAGLAGAIATGGHSVVPTLAVMGGKKLAEKYGNQVAATTANRISKILSVAPKALGEFAPVLQKAASRGTQALTVTSSMLARRDPRYAELLRRINEEESKREPATK